jgi:hypothetical protein
MGVTGSLTHDVRYEMKGACWLFALCTMMLWGVGSAAAKGPGSAGPATVVLITEVVEDGERRQTAFWWENAREPAWTVTDRLVLEELSARSIAHVRPGQTNISRIHRRPHLSLENGSTLGGLLGASQVLVGEVRYEVEPRIVQLGLYGVRATAQVELVAAQVAQPRSLKRFTVERRVFASNRDEALEQAREQTARALGAVIAANLSRSAAPVGIASKEPLIGLRNAESHVVLEQIIEFLVKLEGVDAVRERWAAEGIIALEINPGRIDADDVIEYVLRVLEHHTFEDFRLTRRRSGPVADLAEFDVERLGAEGL